MMLQAFREGFGRYACFSGRTSRRPFWIFVSVTQLVLALVALPLLVLGFEALLYLSDELTYLLMGGMGAGATPEQVLELWDASRGMTEDLLDCTWGYMGDLWMEQPALYASSAGVFVVLALVLACPTLAICVRRLRDAGRSPWWVLAFVAACLPLPGVMELGFLISLYVLRLCALPSVSDPQLPKLPPLGRIS